MSEAPVGNLIFVSYRRIDVAPHAVALKLEIETRLQAARVFVDTHGVEGGSEWPAALRHALGAAKVVVPVFGTRWTTSEKGKRRIDDPNDWVFQELSFALTHKRKAIVPVLVDGAPALTRKALPSALGELADLQAVKLDTSQWDATVGELVDVLTNNYALSPRHSYVQYPTPSPVVEKTPPYSWETLVEQVIANLPGWQIEFSDEPQDRFRKRVAITKTFDCVTFEKAMQFLSAAARLAADLDHHPQLENIWKNVTVSLTTFDAGHNVTFVDFKFARFLDREFVKLQDR